MNKLNRFTAIWFMTGFTLILLSCNNKPKNVEYTQYTSTDKSYSVEIPSDIPVYKTQNDRMAFMKEGTGMKTVLILQLNNNMSLQDYVIQEDNGDFDYNLLNESDSTLFFKVTKGVGMYYSYDFYMLKKFTKKRYLIRYSSDENKSDVESRIRHIYNSLKCHEAMTEEKIEDPIQKPNQVEGWSTYRGDSYTISYPKSWKVVKHPDEISDVYIGTESFGIMILHIDTDLSLEEVIETGQDNLVKAGIKVVNSSYVTINGQRCNREVHRMKNYSVDIDQVSYTFVKKGSLYNVKFGTEPEHVMNANKDLIDRIIKTFAIFE